MISQKDGGINLFISNICRSLQKNIHQNTDTEKTMVWIPWSAKDPDEDPGPSAPVKISNFLLSLLLSIQCQCQYVIDENLTLI